MRNKVIIIEPRGVEANVFAKYIHLPLMGPLYLGTILKQAGFDVRILNENLLGRDVLLHELKADFLLLSLLTPTAERGYELARKFRETNPGSKVIIGGIHPSFVPEEAAAYADHVVCGEGEEVIVDLLRHGSEEKILTVPLIRDLDDLPIPDFNLLVKKKKLDITPVISSRGCPFDCNFCSVTEMFGRRYRAQSVDRVMEELERARTKWLFFYDDNFAANPKRTHALLDRMIARKFGFKWFAQVRADVTRDRELVEKMRQAGCHRVYIGFESIEPETLKELHKKQNPEQVSEAIRVFHRNKINIHGMFIFGSDEDRPEVFRKTSAFCRKNRLSSVQFLILTPLPGTAFYRRMEEEHRLLHKMWGYYDGMHTVFQPFRFTPSELQEGIITAFQDFYSYVNIMNESINIFFETAKGLLTSLPAGIKLPSLSSPIIKLQAKTIIRKWKWLNRDYLSYLRDLRWPRPANQSPMIVSDH